MGYAPQIPPTTFDNISHGDVLLLIPIKKVCKTPSDVVNLIEKVFRDIRDKKALTEFEVAKTLKSDGKQKAFDALILEPTAFGVGVDLKKLLKLFKK